MTTQPYKLMANSRLSPLPPSRSTPTELTEARSPSNARSFDTFQTWKRRRHRLNRILSPTIVTKRPDGDDGTRSTELSLHRSELSPAFKAIERGFHKFSVNRSPKPGLKRLNSRANKLELVAAHRDLSLSPSNPRSSCAQSPQHKSQLLTPSTHSNARRFSLKTEDLTEQILAMRHRRLEVQQLMQDSVTQKHQLFSKIVSEVKSAFKLQTVAAERQVKGKYNQFDTYLNSRELMAYLKSL